MIYLYKAYEEETPDFTRHGLGNLNDAISYTVTKAALIYELQMQYPVIGKRFSDLKTRRVIYATPDQVDNAQPFIIYRISKAVKGKVSVYARHISYELSGIPVNTFRVISASNFANVVKNYVLAGIQCPFQFSTNVFTSGTLEVTEPCSIRSLLGGGEDTWQGAYGGELVFDGYDVKLLRSAGQDRGVRIRYGVDLIDAQMEENIADMYTGIVPYYIDDKYNVFGDYLSAGEFNHVKALAVDVTQYVSLSDSDSSATKKEKVETVGRTWMQENGIGKPKVSLRVSYAQLDQVVQLYDTVTVFVERLGIDVKAKVSRTVYDGMRDRYNSVDVGEVRSSLSDEVFDAGRLRKGLLPVERIRDKSITSDKYASGSVNGEALADWNAIRAKLASGVVNEVSGSQWAAGISASIYNAQKDATDVGNAYSALINTLKSSSSFEQFKNNAKDKDKG